MTTKPILPVLFIGHGSPENALEDNEFTQGWSTLASSIPTPRLILCISAHWMTEGTAVTAMERPKTIHDFYGFPDALYQVEYPAPGSIADAEKIQKMIQSVPVSLDTDWGLDHGTWSVLVKMYPKAEIPVLQLSLDATITRDKMFEIGKELASLRDDGVLIIGSGNVVHNLRMLSFGGEPYPWTIEFDAQVKDYIQQGKYEHLVDYIQIPSARLAHPTDEHYLPLLYVLGAAGVSVPRFFNKGYYAGSLSMRCVVWE